MEDLPLSSVSGPDFPAPPTLGERMDRVAGFLRRQYLIILICFLLSLPFWVLELFHSDSKLYRFQHDDDRDAQEPVTIALG